MLDIAWKQRRHICGELGYNWREHSSTPVTVEAAVSPVHTAHSTLLVHSEGAKEEDDGVLFLNDPLISSFSS